MNLAQAMGPTTMSVKAEGACSSASGRKDRSPFSMHLSSSNKARVGVKM